MICASPPPLYLETIKRRIQFILSHLLLSLMHAFSLLLVHTKKKNTVQKGIPVSKSRVTSQEISKKSKQRETQMTITTSTSLGTTIMILAGPTLSMLVGSFMVLYVKFPKFFQAMMQNFSGIVDFGDRKRTLSAASKRCRVCG